MRIIIIGNGKVGYTLAKQLSGENHDLVLIDKNAEALANAEGRIGYSVRGGQRSLHPRAPGGPASGGRDLVWR